MPDLKSKLSFSLLKRSPRKNATQEPPQPMPTASGSSGPPASRASQDSVTVGRYRPPSQASDASQEVARASSAKTEVKAKPAPMPRVLTDEQRRAGNKSLYNLSDTARLNLGLSQRQAESLNLAYHQRHQTDLGPAITSANSSLEKRQNLGNRTRIAHPPSAQRSDTPDAAPYMNRAASKSTPNLRPRPLPTPPPPGAQLPSTNASTTSLPKSFKSLPAEKTPKPLPKLPMSEKARGKQRATTPEL